VDDNFDGGKMLEGTADIDDVMASYVFLLSFFCIFNPPFITISGFDQELMIDWS